MLSDSQVNVLGIFTTSLNFIVLILRLPSGTGDASWPLWASCTNKPTVFAQSPQEDIARTLFIDDLQSDFLNL